jgi:hypothetical protein
MRNKMKTALILSLSCASFCLAQDMKIAPPVQAPQTQTAPQPDSPDKGATPDQFKRLASVTWDLNTHKLVWTVEKGDQVNGEFVPKSTSRYEVSPSEGFMAADNEKRGIADDEANSLHELLSVLSLYCVESTVWWENGGDDGADKTAAPAKPAPPIDAKPGKKTGSDGKTATPADPNAKPTRVDQPQQKPKAPLVPGALIAEQ